MSWPEHELHPFANAQAVQLRGSAWEDQAGRVWLCWPCGRWTADGRPPQDGYEIPPRLPGEAGGPMRLVAHGLLEEDCRGLAAAWATDADRLARNRATRLAVASGLGLLRLRERSALLLRCRRGDPPPGSACIVADGQVLFRLPSGRGWWANAVAPTASDGWEWRFGWYYRRSSVRLLAAGLTVEQIGAASSAAARRRPHRCSGAAAEAHLRAAGLLLPWLYPPGNCD